MVTINTTVRQINKMFQQKWPKWARLYVIITLQVADK